jgi:hypothetical protein
MSPDLELVYSYPGARYSHYERVRHQWYPAPLGFLTPILPLPTAVKSQARVSSYNARLLANLDVRGRMLLTEQQLTSRRTT